MTFAITTDAILAHMNVRKEGDKDDGVLALDLKLECQVGADVLASFHPTLRSFLFADDGRPRFAQMDAVRMKGRMERRSLQISGVRIQSADLKRFEFEPLAGERVAMTFTASLRPESGAQTAQLAELVNEMVKLEVLDDELQLALAPEKPVVIDETSLGAIEEVAKAHGAKDVARHAGKLRKMLAEDREKAAKIRTVTYKRASTELRITIAPLASGFAWTIHGRIRSWADKIGTFAEFEQLDPKRVCPTADEAERAAKAAIAVKAYRVLAHNNTYLSDQEIAALPALFAWCGVALDIRPPAGREWQPGWEGILHRTEAPRFADARVPAPRTPRAIVGPLVSISGSLRRAVSVVPINRQ